VSGDFRFPIPPSTPQRACRSCTRPIYWIETRTGKRMPVDPDGTSHFATCEHGDQWRKPGLFGRPRS